MNCIETNHNVGQYAGYKTRVLAAYFFEILTEKDTEKLSEIFAFSREKNLEILWISGGTNILFAKDFFPGIVIKNSLKGWNFDEQAKKLSIFSGEKISDIAEVLEKNFSEPIWHRFIGLPGTIAGAVVGNAGCFGLETENNFFSAKILDISTGETKILQKSDMNFWYRHSILKENPNYFLISAEFDLSEIREKYASDVDNIDFRENKQPKGNSCGSFFKNPGRDASAGSLIEQIGFKWKRHGGARWSDLHANFLLSDGETCKPSDLIELIRLTQKTVFEKTGFELVNEVRIIE